MTALADLIGRRFSELTVVSRALNDQRGRARWHCRCDCGGETVSSGGNLLSGRSTSCGCSRATHGATRGYVRSPEFSSWSAMRARCYDPKHRAHKNYGGRGITVCARWRDDFEAFLADMGPKPSPQHSIERIDNDGNYQPGNCRWATMKEQRANQRPCKPREKLTHCANGHELSGDNVLVAKTGARRCRICSAKWYREMRARQKEERTAP